MYRNGIARFGGSNMSSESKIDVHDVLWCMLVRNMVKCLCGCSSICKNYWIFYRCF